MTPPAVLLMVSAAPPFLAFWLGASMGAKTAPIACILLFGIWTNSFGRIVQAHILARGRPNWVAYLLISEILPYGALLYLLLRVAGLPGAALAWSLRCLIDTLGLFIIDRSSRRDLKPLGMEAALVALAITLPHPSALGLVGLWRHRRLRGQESAFVLAQKATAGRSNGRAIVAISRAWKTGWARPMKENLACAQLYTKQLPTSHVRYFVLKRDSAPILPRGPTLLTNASAAEAMEA